MFVTPGGERAVRGIPAVDSRSQAIRIIFII